MVTTNKRQPILYAVMRTGHEEIPVVVEHGSAEYMMMFCTGNPDAEINWYGLMIEDANLARLRLEIDEDGGATTYKWKHIEVVIGESFAAGNHISPGDIFTSHMFDPSDVIETGEDEQPNYYTFAELMGKDVAVLRSIARDNGVDYYNTIPRVKLAMLLNAPTDQDQRCPDTRCRAKLTEHHKDGCTVAQCMVTGDSRVDCDRKHKEFCGQDRWIGFGPCVLESFAYSVSPERVLVQGAWSAEHEVFLIEDGPVPVDVDETYEVPPPSMDDLTAKLKGALTESRSAATGDGSVQETAEKIGVDTAQAEEEGWDGYRRTRREGRLRPLDSPLLRETSGYSEPDIEIERGSHDVYSSKPGPIGCWPPVEDADEFASKQRYEDAKNSGLSEYEAREEGWPTTAQNAETPPTPSTGTPDVVSGGSDTYSGSQGTSSGSGDTGSAPSGD
jgi:hypothetical protein